MLVSLGRGSVVPNVVQVLDNGNDAGRLGRALAGVGLPEVRVFTPAERMGVAAAWNWFIDNAPEERVIANDDVTFAYDSLAKLLASDADIVWAEAGFSCFVLRDACIAKLGRFDETLSPGYGYYEDCDYLQRLDGKGTRAPSARAETVKAGIRHFHSGTLKAASHAEIIEHHRKFKIAQANYARKWGLEREFGLEKTG